MSPLSRRILIKAASVVLPVAAVARSLHGEAPASEPGFLHVFAFRWKEGATEAQKERARKEILAFQGVVPGLLQAHVGPNLSEKGEGYTFGGVMQFTTRAAFQAYTTHPAHKALLTWLVPLISAIELDLSA